jgi:bis(5'-nucleosyl)-tetraphosphatase (symmetrical)
MATYAIGDIQGCYDTLQRLLDRMAFDPSSDTAWLVGDLVNRGPKSLEVLRWVKGLGSAAVAVLGNHDLHLLASAVGLRKPKRRDTLAPVLQAPDRDELIEWLRHRPLLHREGRFVMTHAGILPAWSVDDAEARAHEIEALLRGDDWAALLARTYPATPPPWRDQLEGWERRASILAALVRMRTVRADGSLCDDFAGPPDSAPAGCTPWFDAPGRRTGDTCVVFGHWAALGLHLRDDLIALDSGCVWGESLSAVRLEDRAVFQHPAVD